MRVFFILQLIPSRMRHVVLGTVILLVLGIAVFLVETHRTWGMILFLLALIFYGLFANPMKKVSEKTTPRPSPRASRKKRSR